MLETNDLLVKCPRCGAWPMPVSVQKSALSQSEITFRCSECGSEQAGRLRRASSRVNEHRNIDAA